LLRKKRTRICERRRGFGDAKSGTKLHLHWFISIDVAAHGPPPPGLRGTVEKFIRHTLEVTMRLPSKTLAAALMAAAVPLYTGPAAAAPLSQSLALNSADVGTVEQVQYRRWRSGRWIGPAAGIAAGVAIGSALAPRYYDDGYYAYGAAPGYYVEPGYAYGAAPGYYAYGAAPGYYVAPRYRYDTRFRGNPQYGSCTGDREGDTSYPSWACR
jgi:hypothetical protein